MGKPIERISVALSQEEINSFFKNLQIIKKQTGIKSTNSAIVYAVLMYPRLFRKAELFENLLDQCKGFILLLREEEKQERNYDEPGF